MHGMRFAGMWLALLFVLGALLSSCGTGMSPVGGTQDTGFDRLLPAGAPLPTVPLDSAAPLGGRTTSAVTQVNGSDFFQASGGTVDGTSLNLQSGQNDLAWGLYKVSGLSGHVDTFSVETLPGELGMQYSVGLGSFSDHRWEWVVTTSLPEVSLDLSGDQRKFISDLGNLYFVVVVNGGDSVRVDLATIETGEGGNGGGLYPPEGLTASVDPFAGVYLSWKEVQGARGYEVWRSGDSGDPNGFGPGDDYWLQIGSTDQAWFADYSVQPNSTYGYKVRAFDEAGQVSEFCDPVWVTTGGGGSWFSLEGEIEAIDATTVTVQGQTVFHDDTTLWYDEDYNIAGWEDFAVGDRVYVDGSIAPDGSATAATVYRYKTDDDPGNDWTYTGTISAIGNGSLTLDDQMMFSYDDNTQWLLPDGMEGGPDDFAVGDMVNVVGSGDPALGGMYASIVQAADRNQP